MKRIRFGLVGTSEISEKMAQALAICPKTIPWCIYSRSKEKGETFARKNHIPHSCQTLDEMAQCVDTVYIASPNSFHFRQTMFFLERNIPVLCEKPLASNLAEVTKMTEYAQKNNVYLAEAYKSQFMPAYKLMKEKLPLLGTIRNVNFNFSKYSSRYDAHLRREDVNTFKAEFSNGALLDLGVYCLYPALDLFGNPESVTASGILVPGGVDGLGSAVLKYRDFLVNLNYSKVSTGSRQCEIQGENGTMTVDAISSPRTIEMTLKTGERTVFSPYTEENDMVYECEAFADSLAAGIQTDPKPHQAAFQILDMIRKTVGIQYPADEN